MNEIQKKLAERYKQDAIEWYKEKKTGVVAKKHKYEEEDLTKEIELIEKIEHIIENSSIEESRKAIFIGSLRSSKEELKQGNAPERLPNIIHNLVQKDQIGNRIMAVCQSTFTAGKSYAYLWGL